MCHRANTVTAECDCQDSLFNKMQRLRLVGEPSCPLPMTDITIYAMKYTALVSLSTRETFVSPKVVEDYDEYDGDDVKHFGLYNSNNKRVAVELHISIGNRLLFHPCRINADMAYDVILGSDFLMKFGFGFRLGNISINNHSPRFSTYDEIRYWRKISSVNGPKMQENKAKLINFPKDDKIIKIPGLVRRSHNETIDENEDVLEIHPSNNELELMQQK